MLRDLLVALPGLIGPTGTMSRVPEIQAQDASQVIVPAAVTSSRAIALPEITASSDFLRQAMIDYYKQTGFQPLRRWNPNQNPTRLSSRRRIPNPRSCPKAPKT
ncbi:hypothetical protein ACFSYD_25215 [Paracoccus aerius]